MLLLETQQADPVRVPPGSPPAGWVAGWPAGAVCLFLLVCLEYPSAGPALSQAPGILLQMRCSENRGDCAFRQPPPTIPSPTPRHWPCAGGRVHPMAGLQLQM